MARLSGCPSSIKDSDVKIKNQVSDEMVKIKGMSTLNVELSADTEDGSTGDALWSEPYVTKRSGTVSMDGKPVSDPMTGVRDSGQEMLIEASMSEGGCENDQTIYIADTTGHAMELDVVVTSFGQQTDETGETISFGMDLVGEPRVLPYVQVTGVSAKDGATTLDSTVNTLTVDVNDTSEFTVDIVPASASNQKFGVTSSDKTVARISAIEDNVVHVLGVKAGTATITIKTMNNQLTTTFRVVVG